MTKFFLKFHVNGGDLAAPLYREKMGLLGAAVGATVPCFDRLL